MVTKQDHYVLTNEEQNQFIPPSIHSLNEMNKKIEQLYKEQKNLIQLLEESNQSKVPGIHIYQLKVNNIQSGAAFNLGERIICNTKSDMDMDLGPNSMNIGDNNSMENHEDREPLVKLYSLPES